MSRRSCRGGAGRCALCLVEGMLESLEVLEGEVVKDTRGVLKVPEVSEVMRCALLCMLEGA